MKYKTSDLAGLLGVTANTIRRYEKNGYTVPERDSSNYRQYRENDIFKIAIIRLYRKHGFSHEEIKAMLDGTGEDTSRILRQRLAETEKEIERLQNIKLWIENSLCRSEELIKSDEKFIHGRCDDLRYVLFSDGNRFLREAERLEIIKAFMYDVSEVHMIQLWKGNDLSKSFSAPPPSGWAIKKEFFDELPDKIKNSPYILSYPSVECIMGVMQKHPKNFDPRDNHSKIARKFFESAHSYMDKNGLSPSGDAIGMIENSLSDAAGILVYMPIVNIQP